MRHLPHILSALCLSALVACSGTPDYVIPPDKMAALMADVHTGESVVESNARNYPNDSTKKVLIQSIYMKHGVTSQEVDTSLYWYGQNIEKYMDVYDKTIEILEKRIAEAEKSGAKADKSMMRVTVDGDSVDIWQGPTSRRNTEMLLSNYISFHYATDKNWERGDRYTLNVRPVNIHSQLSMSMAVEYNDGTTEYVSYNQSGDGMKHLTLVLDSAKVATHVYGSLHYAARGGEVSYLDSLSLVRTRGRNDNVRARSAQRVIRHR